MAKQRVNLMIEDYDNEYLEETSKVYHISKSELVKLAINLLTSVNENDESVLEQLANNFDKMNPSRSNLPLNEKIMRASNHVFITIS